MFKVAELGEQLMRITSNTCLNCGGTLIAEPFSTDVGKGTIDGADCPSWLEYDGNKHYIKCQQCSATNIVIIREDSIGTSILTVSRAMMEDE